MEKMTKAVMEKQEIAERKMGELCRGWLNNRMCPILGMLQHIHAREERVIERALFFLEDVEHHFMESDCEQAIRNAFRYLHRYFKVYPNVSLKNCRKAIEMVKRIYAALGLNLGHGFDPRFSTQERVRRIVQEKARKEAAFDARLTA